MAKKDESAVQDFPFYQYLRLFYVQNKGAVKRRYKRLSLKFLDYNDPGESGNEAFLRGPQFEALEMYIFLKEFSDNRHLWEIFKDWSEERNGFAGRGRFSIGAEGQTGLFEEQAVENYEEVFKMLRKAGQAYPNYVYALTMGLGKTILMATCIFYEFLLANKFPKDERFCQNALVFAPDKTVLQSLKEIITFDKQKVIPPEYANWLDTHLRFYFLDDTGLTLNSLDRSKYNVIISNTQKIILKKQQKEKGAGEKLFSSESETYEKKANGGDEFDDLYDLETKVEDEADLLSNQRFAKLTRLSQLGIYIDEAHHAFGNKLAADMGLKNTKTSLRVTVDELAAHLKEAGTRVVACYNYTGTPYVGNRLLPEIVYAYGLSDAIDKAYLKKVQIDGYSNARDKEFLRAVVGDFWQKYADQRYEGMLPKLAIFAGTIEELEKDVRPALEAVLIQAGIPTDKILVNVGDEKLTSNDDLREFLSLDTKASEKQFILLVGKGKEGWNCRSLFGVAMHRKPKSRVFVLQATMRCLRAITATQQTATVYLSEECRSILDDELQENFRLTVDEINKKGSKKIEVKVRPLPPPVTLKLKRQAKLHKLEPKELSDKVDLMLKGLVTDPYRIIHRTYDGKDLSKVRVKEDITYIRDKVEYSELTLVAEIARYLNEKPSRIRRILETSKDGMKETIAAVNAFNEILYDYVIPRLFNSLYDLKEFTSEEEYEIELVKQPENEEGFYRVKAEPELLANHVKEPYSGYKTKSFHLDNYCFDSRPEKVFFESGLRHDDLDKIWFTGMLTHGQSEFLIRYIDPQTHALRSYYPDFLIRRKDGGYILAEVKGENAIDNAVVLAKKTYAEQMASVNAMTYRVVPSKRAGESCWFDAEIPEEDVVPQLEPFIWVYPKDGKPPANAVRIYDLAVAAGYFSEGQIPEPEGWVELDSDRKLSESHFVAKVVGKSMEPRIPDGAWCLFSRDVAGSRNGRVLIVQHREVSDPETGGSYTIKEYRRQPQALKDGEESQGEVTLLPANREFDPIIITEDLEDIKVIGELVEVL